MSTIKDLVYKLSQCSLRHCGYKKENLVTSTDWIKKLAKSYRFSKKTIGKIPPHVFCYRYTSNIRKQIIDNPSLYPQVKENWIKEFNNTDEDTRFFMCKLFYLANILDDDTSRLIVKFAKETKNEAYKFWTIMDISKMTFSLQKGFYPEYYNERREVLLELAQDYHKMNLVSKGNTDTIALMFYTLEGTMYNSATRLAKIISDGLLKYNDHIEIIVTDTFVPVGKEKKLITTEFKTLASSIFDNELKDILDKRVKLHYISGNSRLEKLTNLENTLNEIDPKVIIDVTDEYSFESFYYSKMVPTIYIPMRNYSSSSFYNYTLGKKWKYDVLNEKYHSVDEKKIVEWSFPEVVPTEGEVITREQLGLSKDSFVIVTIGKNEDELSNDLVDKMAHLLKNNPNFQWLIVGGNAPIYLKEKYHELLDNHSIIEQGYEKNLYGLCQSCNITLRPNTTGGSGGTAIAAQCGLPVVMTSFTCDPMRWLGQDYSSIKDYDGLIDEIKRLYEDKDYYSKQQKLVKEKIKEGSDANKRFKELSEFIEELK